MDLPEASAKGGELMLFVDEAVTREIRDQPEQVPLVLHVTAPAMVPVDDRSLSGSMAGASRRRVRFADRAHDLPRVQSRQIPSEGVAPHRIEQPHGAGQHAGAPRPAVERGGVCCQLRHGGLEECGGQGGYRGSLNPPYRFAMSRRIGQRAERTVNGPQLFIDPPPPVAKRPLRKPDKRPRFLDVLAGLVNPASCGRAATVGQATDGRDDLEVE